MTEIEKEYYRRLALQEEYGGTNKPVNKIIPLVSVVTITYQHAPYIRQCLDGILMQETDFPYELIIGEDGSTDGTREICIEYANKYPDKIRLFLRDRTLSHYVYSNGNEIMFNFNFCISEARGKYIALCEGDDYWSDKEKLQLQYTLMENNPKVSLCIHAVERRLLSSRLYEDSFRGDIHDSESYTANIVLKPKRLLSIKNYLNDERGFDTSSYFFRTRYLVKIPEFVLHSLVGDQCIVLICLYYGPAAYINRVMSVYRIGVENSWTAKMKSSFKLRFIHYRNYIEMLMRYSLWSKFRYSYLFILPIIIKSRGMVYDYRNYIHASNEH